MSVCKHERVTKRIGFGADGKTYCTDCGAERPPFSFLDLMADRTGAVVVDLAQEPQFAPTLSPRAVAEIERLEQERALALHRCRDMIVGDGPASAQAPSGSKGEGQ